MVRVLVTDDFAELFRAVILQRGLARQIGDADHPAEPGFGSILPGGYHPVGVVECAGHDLDPGTADTAKTQRRAAGGTEIPLGDRGRFERGRLAAGPGEIGALDVGERGEGRARCLLAHPAVTDADLCRRMQATNGYIRGE